MLLVIRLLDAHLQHSQPEHSISKLQFTGLKDESEKKVKKQHTGTVNITTDLQIMSNKSR